MNVGKVRISAVPQLVSKDNKAVAHYRTQIVWIEKHTSFMMPNMCDTSEEAIMKGVAMLDWLRDTFGEDYELTQS